MSVSKRGKYYHFDFWYGGVRFRGSTGEEEKKAAKRHEKALKKQKRESKNLPKQSIKLGAAFKRYHEEHAMMLASAENIEYQLDRLLRLGKERPLDSITDGDMAKYVAKRHTEVSISSTNREITLFRAVCNKSHDAWGFEKPNIKWRAHIGQEPAPQQNTLTDEEEKELLENLPEDLHPFVLFCLLTGARLTSVTSLTWKQVDFRKMIVRLKVKSRRKGETHTIPLTPDLVTLLANEKGNHPIYVFTYLCKRNRPKRIKGHRYPLTKTNWRRFWRKARLKIGRPEFRFHDLRHTAATRLLQSCNNVAIVQKLLGHADIKTTMRYAHVQVDQVRDAMVDATTHISPHNEESDVTSKEEKG